MLNKNTEFSVELTNNSTLNIHYCSDGRTLYTGTAPVQISLIDNNDEQR